MRQNPHRREYLPGQKSDKPYQRGIKRRVATAQVRRKHGSQKNKRESCGQAQSRQHHLHDAHRVESHPQGHQTNRENDEATGLHVFIRSDVRIKKAFVNILRNQRTGPQQDGAGCGNIRRPQGRQGNAGGKRIQAHDNLGQCQRGIDVRILGLGRHTQHSGEKADGENDEAAQDKAVPGRAFRFGAGGNLHRRAAYGLGHHDDNPAHQHGHGQAAERIRPVKRHRRQLGHDARHPAVTDQDLHHTKDDAQVNDQHTQYTGQARGPHAADDRDADKRRIK